MTKALRLLLEIALLCFALLHILNAFFGFAPEIPTDVSLGWACLFLLLVLINREVK